MNRDFFHDQAPAVTSADSAFDGIDRAARITLGWKSVMRGVSLLQV
jgi:hypothetical protein